VRFERHVLETGNGRAVTSCRALGGGRSADTLRATVARQDGSELDCVVHLQPAAGPLAGISDVERQYAVLEALVPTPVRAPCPRWLCRDRSVLGQPFFVTDYVPGEVPSPWGAEGRSWLSRQPPGGPLAWSFLRELVAIHSVEPERLRMIGGDDPCAAASYSERERSRWSTILSRSREFADDPVLNYADAWLATRRPVPAPPALVHGDYRIGNLVIRDSAITAVLDWELATVGDPVSDLGTICAPPLRTNGLAAGLWEPEALVSVYEELRGLSVDRAALAYHRVLATFKIASLWVNASAPLSSGEPDLRALRARYSALETRPMLAEALGLATSPGEQTGAVTANTAAVLHAVIRDQVLPAIDGDEPRERLRAVMSILRAESAAQPDRASEVLQMAVDELAAAAAPVVGRDADRSGSIAAPARLARLARSILALPGVGADESAPLHAQLRAAVAIAAVPGRGARS
jgi:aminoglycoside phosphotransferase (APT) family kinase protein